MLLCALTPETTSVSTIRSCGEEQRICAPLLAEQSALAHCLLCAIQRIASSPMRPADTPTGLWFLTIALLVIWTSFNNTVQQYWPRWLWWQAPEGNRDAGKDEPEVQAAAGSGETGPKQQLVTKQPLDPTNTVENFGAAENITPDVRQAQAKATVQQQNLSNGVDANKVLPQDSSAAPAVVRPSRPRTPRARYEISSADDFVQTLVDLVDIEDARSSLVLEATERQDNANKAQWEIDWRLTRHTQLSERNFSPLQEYVRQLEMDIAAYE